MKQLFISLLISIAGFSAKATLIDINDECYETVKAISKASLEDFKFEVTSESLISATEERTYLLKSKDLSDGGYTLILSNDSQSMCMIESLKLGIK